MNIYNLMFLNYPHKIFRGMQQGSFKIGSSIDVYWRNKIDFLTYIDHILNIKRYKSIKKK